MLRIIACVVVLAATLTALAGAARLADADWRGVAPFTGFALSADGMLVEYDDAWWRLLAVDGITSENLLATARGTFGDDLAEKRLAGDLHEVLVAAGWDPGGEVDLLLEPESGGEPVLAADVEMNAAKRWRVWRARQTGD
jgi:hypothetical protein